MVPALWTAALTFATASPSHSPQNANTYSLLLDSFDPYYIRTDEEEARRDGHPLCPPGDRRVLGLQRRFAHTGVASTKAPAQYLRGINAAYPGVRIVHLDPLIVVVDDFFTSEECDAYRALASSDRSHHHEQSATFGGTSTTRTSTTWFVRYQDCVQLLAKACALTGQPVASMEEPQLVQYRPGQQFGWHYDAIVPRFLTRGGGQRVATLLVYCNDVDKGGRTVFRDLLAASSDEDGAPRRLEVQPKKGRALLFFPASGEGVPDFRTLHAGEPAGEEKWVAQLWMHQGPYQPEVPNGTDQREGARLAALAVHRLAAPFEPAVAER